MSGRRRVGVYDLYWGTLGGGEQVAGTMAEVLSRDHDVTLLSPDHVDADLAMERLGVDVSACGSRYVVDDVDASAASVDFDLFINGTYRSRAVNRSPLGWYYVHFPQIPPGRSDTVRHLLGIAGVRALSLPPRLPERLVQVQAGFGRRVQQLGFVATYERYIANSNFTAQWVRRLWDVPAEVIYPPVRSDVAVVGKQPTILNVGRFFDPRSGHSKKQLELIGAFKQAAIAGWELVLAGGCDGANREYVLSARRAAIGTPIALRVNARGEVVRRLLAEASIYWHAGGLGEDPDRHPERFEHFGIAVVEAMAAGVVPLVFAAAGPAEIVEHGINGYHWRTVDELVDRTRRLVADPGLRDRLGEAARQRARDFSVTRFADAVSRLAREPAADS